MLSELSVQFGTNTTMNIYIFSTIVKVGSICETTKLTPQVSLKDMGKTTKIWVMF